MDKETGVLIPEELSLRTPRSQRAREAQSLAMGGISLRVRDLFEEGKSPQQIKIEAGISTMQLDRARKRLRGWNVDLPYTITLPSKNLELANNLRKAETDEKKREFLGQVRHKFYIKHITGKDALLLVSIGNVAKEAGLSKGFHSHDLTIIVRLLKNVKFPMGELPQKVKDKNGIEKNFPWRFILAKDKERVIKVIEELQEQKGFAKTISFIQMAFAENAHLNIPKRSSKDLRERDLGLTLVYLLNPDLNQEDTGKTYNVRSRQRVQQIIYQTVKDLWQNCSRPMQVFFPIEELILEKPLTQKTREKISLALGGISIKVRDKLMSGKSVEQIERELGALAVVHARKVLKGWGIEVGYIRPPYPKTQKAAK